jgi:hypothetical protein
VKTRQLKSYYVSSDFTFVSHRIDHILKFQYIQKLILKCKMNGLVSGYGTDSDSDGDEHETAAKPLTKNSVANTANTEGKIINT